MSMDGSDSMPSDSDRSDSELDQKTLAFIDALAREIYQSIDRGELPTLDVLVRSLKNVTYDSKKGYLELGDAVKHRTMTVSTVRSFAQTLRLMATSPPFNRRTMNKA